MNTPEDTGAVVYRCPHLKTRKFGFRLTRTGKKPQIQCLICGKVFVKEEENENDA